jgi:all-trans-retinol 13,14-reductase
MRTFLTVKLALAPFALFWTLLGLATPGVALVMGAAASLAVCTWRLSRREIMILELGGFAVFLILGAAAVAAPDLIADLAAPLSLAGLGLVCLGSVALRRPWTADYSRAAYAASADSPIFIRVNMALSALWGALFLLLAAARLWQLNAWATTGIVLFGAAISILGPRLMLRLAVRRAMAAAESYRWEPPRLGGRTGEAEADVAVVGAGIGGLTAAALLADAGLKVLVAEHHVLPGGFCHTFLRKARHHGQPCLYRFDAGPHDFSGLWPGGPVDAVLQRLGLAQRLTWRAVDHRYQLGDIRLDVPRDWRAYVAELGRLFPPSAAGLAALFDEIQTIHAGMYATGWQNGGIPGLPTTVEAMVAFPREHPLAFRWLRRPFAELVAQHVQEPAARRLINALTGYISDRAATLTCAEMVPLFGYYFHGGVYPLGGSGRLAEVLVEAIEARGGTVRLKAPVERIVVDEGRAAGIVLRDGSHIGAGAVVSNADLKRTFVELLEPGHLPADFRAHIAGAAPAASAFMVHLGVDFVPNIRPSVHLLDGFRMGIETLSLVDPGAAPPGHSTIGLITLLPHGEARRWFPAEAGDDWKAWRRSTDYEERKTAFGDRMIAAAEAVIPGLADHIVYRTDASPITYARYDWATTGAIYGISSEGRLRGVKSPVPGLVIAGSSTHGPGVEAAVISGACAANALVPGLLAREAPPQARAA